MRELTATLKERLADAIESYAVGERLGSGGMAIVYEGRDGVGRRVAIKVLRPELASLIGLERFLREIDVASQLVHPSVIPVWDAGVADGLPYFVMPMIDGETLGHRLHAGPLDPVEALRILRRLLEVLRFAHDKGFVHRDMKPANVLLNGAEVLVADFGLARAIDAAGGEKLTATGTVVGTPAYMSPEQASGAGGLDGRTDIFSLGCMLYEMLTGRLAFDAPTADEAIAMRFSKTPPSLDSEGVSPELVGVYNRMMALRPENRFASADEVLGALEGLEIEADAPDWPIRTLLIGALVLALAILVAGRMIL